MAIFLPEATKQYWFINPLEQNFHFLAFFEGLRFEHLTNVNLITDSITNCTIVVKPKKPKNQLFGILLLI